MHFFLHLCENFSETTQCILRKGKVKNTHNFIFILFYNFFLLFERSVIKIIALILKAIYIWIQERKKIQKHLREETKNVYKIGRKKRKEMKEWNGTLHKTQKSHDCYTEKLFGYGFLRQLKMRRPTNDTLLNATHMLVSL